MTSEKGGEDTPIGVEMGKKEQKLKEITMIRLAEISWENVYRGTDITSSWQNACWLSSAHKLNNSYILVPLGGILSKSKMLWEKCDNKVSAKVVIFLAHYTSALINSDT